MNDFIRYHKGYLAWTTFMLLSGLPYAANAASEGISLNKTRLVFTAGSGQATVNVNNSTEDPWLVTTRLSLFSDGKGKTPLFVSPPIFRLDGHSSNMLRIVGDVSHLPKDRESVFYLNVTGIPKGNPLARDGDGGFLSGGIAYSVGNIIKVFYRPDGLAGSAEYAAKNLAFSRTSAGIVAKNQSPYYVSMLSLKLNGRDVKFDDRRPSMLSPFSQATYPQQSAYPLSQEGIATWVAVNDLGGSVASNGEIK